MHGVPSFYGFTEGEVVELRNDFRLAAELLGEAGFQEMARCMTEKAAQLQHRMDKPAATATLSVDTVNLKGEA